METRRSLRIRGDPPKEGPRGGNKSTAKEEPKTKGGGKAKGDAKKGDPKKGDAKKGDAKKGAGGGKAKEEKGKKTSQGDQNKKEVKGPAGGKRVKGEVEGGEREEGTEQDISNETNEAEELPKKGSKTGKDASNRVEATKGKKSLEETNPITTVDAESECTDVTSLSNRRSERNVKGGGMLLRKQSSGTIENDGGNGSTSRSRKGKEITGGTSGGGIKGVKEEEGGEEDHSLRRGKSKEGSKQNDSVKREDQGGGCGRSGKGGSAKGKAAGKGSPGKAPPGKVPPGKDPPDKGPPGKGSPGKGSPGKGSPGKGSPGKGSPGKGSPGKGSSGKGSPGKGSTGGGSPGKGSPDVGSPGDQRKGASQTKRAKGAALPIKVKVKGDASVGKGGGKGGGKTAGKTSDPAADTAADAANEKIPQTVPPTSENASPQGKGKWRGKGNRRGGAEDEPVPASHFIKNMDSEELESSRARCSSNRSSTVEWSEQLDAGVSAIGGAKQGGAKPTINRSIKRRLSQILDVMKKKQVFQLIGDQDEQYGIHFGGDESGGATTPPGGDLTRGATTEKGKEPTDAKAEQIRNWPFLQRVNLDVIYNKLHFDFYEGEEDFHRDMLIIFDRIKLAIETEQNPKEKQNLYQLRCSTWKTYEGEFYKLLLSMKGTKEAKKFSSAQKELREQEDKSLAQLLLGGKRSEEQLEGKQLEEKQLEEQPLKEQRLGEAHPAGDRADHDHDHDHAHVRRSSSSVSVEASSPLGGKKPAEGSHTPFRVRLRLGSFSLDEGAAAGKGGEDNRSGVASLRVSGATSPEKGIAGGEASVAAGVAAGVEASVDADVAANAAAAEAPTEEWKRLIRDHVLQSLTRDSSTAFYFTTPVLEDKNLNEHIKSEYKRKIKKPMDYTTVSRNLTQGVYQNPSEFYRDLKLIFQNCFEFNPDTLQNQYIIEAAKRGQERSSNLWRKWKGRILQAYERGGKAAGEPSQAVKEPPTAPTTPLNPASYAEFFKGMAKKKKKFSSIYSLWVEYLLANRVSFEQLCHMRGINWRALNEKSQAKVSSPREVNLHRFKKLNKRSLPFYVFREEYQAALRERRQEGGKLEQLAEEEKPSEEEKQSEKPAEVGGDSPARDNPQDESSKTLLKDPRTWSHQQKGKPREGRAPKEPSLKPFRRRKRRINDSIFFDEDVFESYLEGKRSCVVKCARNVFLADCFYYRSVVQSLGDFMAEGGDERGEETKEGDLSGMIPKEERIGGVTPKEEDLSGVTPKGEDLSGGNAEEAPPKASKIAFRVRAGGGKKQAQRAVCKGFEESPWGGDETDASWGGGGGGAHEGSVMEGGITHKGNEHTGVESLIEKCPAEGCQTEERAAEETDGEPPLHGIGQLANNAAGPPQGIKEKRKKKKKKGEKSHRAVVRRQVSRPLRRNTLVMNLQMGYCPLEDSSFFQVNEGHVYRQHIDFGFSFVFRSREKLDVALKMERRNVPLFEEDCLQLITIDVMNKCKRNDHLKFLLCNRMAGTGRSLVQVLSDYFARLNSPAGLHEAASELSRILPRVRLYIRDVDVLMRLEKDDVTHVTTIAILKRKVL
ncbi:unnamed protein product [Plasmodium vivax]|uniref:(malaria parasite P. vivax) hypothetical protein n=1 Tax=Plasmodium vivax TaxID=5855 RepID=A0A8S4HMY3_PLAVI|nr:unnamed protein product [Plasmodium vivax]